MSLQMITVTASKSQLHDQMLIGICVYDHTHLREVFTSMPYTHLKASQLLVGWERGWKSARLLFILRSPISATDYYLIT